MSQHSWRLKVARAQKHLGDLQEMLADYIDGDPYRAELVSPSNRNPTQWKFILDITQEPDPSLSVVFGDFLFDMRSALDHIAVALAPRNRKYKASFPISSKDAVTKPDAAERDAFTCKTKGMPDDAVAIIEREQSYNFSQRGGIGSAGAPKVSTSCTL